MAILGRLGGWLYQQPYLLVLLTYFTWALNVVIGRTAAGHVPPMTLSTARWVLATLVLLPFAWPHLKRDWPALRQHLPILFVLGFTGTTGYAMAAYVALQYTEAINGLLIQCTMPLMIGVTSFLLVGERLTGRQIVGIVVSLIGVLAILMRGDLKAHPLSLLTVFAITGVIAILPLLAWELATVPPAIIDRKTILICIYLAIFPSIIAYICYNRGIQMLGPNRVAALYPTIVLFGTGLAIVYLGETPRWYHFVGTVLIVGGVLYATRNAQAAQA